MANLSREQIMGSSPVTMSQKVTALGQELLSLSWYKIADRFMP